MQLALAEVDEGGGWPRAGRAACAALALQPTRQRAVTDRCSSTAARTAPGRARAGGTAPIPGLVDGQLGPWPRSCTSRRRRVAARGQHARQRILLRAHMALVDVHDGHPVGLGDFWRTPGARVQKARHRGRAARTGPGAGDDDPVVARQDRVQACRVRLAPAPSSPSPTPVVSDRRQSYCLFGSGAAGCGWLQRRRAR